MTDKSAKIITRAINDLRKQNINDVEISIDFLGGAVAVMVEAAGVNSTASLLRNLADQVEQHESELEEPKH